MQDAPPCLAAFRSSPACWYSAFLALWRRSLALATRGVGAGRSQALDERRFGDALDSFTGAWAIVPRDPSLCFGAGMAAFMLGRDADAQEWFEKALKLNPRYRGASEWLGQLHYRAGRLKEAIEVYEAALKYAPGASRDGSTAWRVEERDVAPDPFLRGARRALRGAVRGTGR